jgi:hypothetical protein
MAFFFAIDCLAMLEEDNADVVWLSEPVTALEQEAVASPAMREIWSVSFVMMADWELVRCSKQ